MRNVLTLLCAVLLSAAVHATPPSEDAIDELLTVMKVEKTMDASLANIEQLMRQSMVAATREQAPSAEQRRVLDAMPTKFVQVMREEMSWAKMRPVYEQIYRESFTQEEVEGLVAFYKSPVGVASIEKMPVVLQKTMTLMQARMGPFIEKMKAAIQQAVDEPKAAK